MREEDWDEILEKTFEGKELSKDTQFLGSLLLKILGQLHYIERALIRQEKI